MNRQEEFVLRTIEERDIRFVRLWFTDVLGTLKSVAIAPAELEGAFAEGIGFDGSAIEGFARVYEADMLAKPDPSTFQILPWRGDPPGTARMFCDLQLARRHPELRRPAARAPAGARQGRRPRIHLLHPPRDRVLPPRTGTRRERPPGAGRRRRLLRPRAARHRARLPPRRDHDAREHGHLGRVQPPRGCTGPERDRPALRRRPEHGRQHPDLPHGRQGGRPDPGHLRDLHAQAVLRAPRVRACTRTCPSSRATPTRSSRPGRPTS